jgi:predicted RNA methylase
VQGRWFNRWRTYRDLSIYYGYGLNGGGTWLLEPFIEFMKTKHAGRRFRSAYEWCAGPGFFGFALLAAGYCDELVLSDINPRSVAAARKTIRRNDLGNRVRTFCGSGVAALPEDLRFDLVVGNPPNYFRLNPKHPQYKRFRDDLRPNDPEWRIHREFYANIASHLEPDGLVLVSEISPSETMVYLPDSQEPYDIRDRPALDDFREMIDAGGLVYVDTTLYVRGPGVTAEVMTSRKR